MTLEGIAKTTKNKGALGFKGRLKYATEVGIVVIWRLESLESQGLQAHSKGDDLSQHDEVKIGGYIFEFDTNNREDNLGFWLELK